MKITLEFNLPEEAIELRHAIDAGKAFSLINDLDGELRAIEKYRNEVTMEDIRRLRASIAEELPNLGSE